MEGDSEPPTPAQLQAIVGECYKSRNEKEVRKSMEALIDKLDTVTRELGRAILEWRFCFALKYMVQIGGVEVS